jgi:hypothetical protein
MCPVRNGEGSGKDSQPSVKFVAGPRGELCQAKFSKLGNPTLAGKAR